MAAQWAPWQCRLGIARAATPVHSRFTAKRLSIPTLATTTEGLRSYSLGLPFLTTRPLDSPCLPTREPPTAAFQGLIFGSSPAYSRLSRRTPQPGATMQADSILSRRAAEAAPAS